MMSGVGLEHLNVGTGAAARSIAVLTRPGRAPGLFWLGGFRSDMQGSKAEALDLWAADEGRAATRFDYSGHGSSGGAFRDGTISRWLEEAEAVFDAFTTEPQVLLLAKHLAERGDGDRLTGMVLIAPAVDMTKDLMTDRFSAAERRKLKKQGFLSEPSPYSSEPDIITQALIDDGEKHLFGDQPIETGCPVHVIQGMQDEDVPWAHATRLMERLAFDDAVLTLVRDGDHRLSRPEDIERLIRAVEAMVDG
jgi:alpha-beta hydrolase superfamily lysophospholipase